MGRLVVLLQGQFIIMNTCSELYVVGEGRVEERLQGIDVLIYSLKLEKEFVMENNNNNGDTALHDAC